jgi:hypothetical protein
MSVCVICRTPLTSDQGVPCTFCAGWFHLARNTTEGGLSCGRRSLNFLQEGVCGTLYLCRDCDERLAAAPASGATTGDYDIVT